MPCWSQCPLRPTSPVLPRPALSRAIAARLVRSCYMQRLVHPARSVDYCLLSQHTRGDTSPQGITRHIPAIPGVDSLPLLFLLRRPVPRLGEWYRNVPDSENSEPIAGGGGHHVNGIVRLTNHTLNGVYLHYLSWISVNQSNMFCNIPEQTYNSV